MKITTARTFQEALNSTPHPPTQSECFAIFDSLPVVDLSTLPRGMWRGTPFPIPAHPSHDRLTDCGWFGKRFGGGPTANDDVDPLVFYCRPEDADGSNDSPVEGECFATDPARVLPLITQGIRPAGRRGECEMVREGGRGKARLREVKHRGVLTTGMVYDELPIIDYFRVVSYGGEAREVDKGVGYGNGRGGGKSKRGMRIMGVMERKGREGPDYFFVLEFQREGGC